MHSRFTMRETFWAHCFGGVSLRTTGLAKGQMFMNFLAGQRRVDKRRSVELTG